MREAPLPSQGGQEVSRWDRGPRGPRGPAGTLAPRAERPRTPALRAFPRGRSETGRKPAVQGSPVLPSAGTLPSGGPEGGGRRAGVNSRDAALRSRLRGL